MPGRTWTASPWSMGNILWNPRYPNTRWRGVFTAITRLVTLTEPTYVWRGQDDIGWPLIPSINRKLGHSAPIRPQGLARARIETMDEAEALIQRARDRQHDALDGWRMPDLALLALLQHNGAATPLLDVTTDPIVALHFACQQNPNNDSDGLVIAIDVRDRRVQQFTVGAQNEWRDALDLVSSKGVVGLYSPPMVTPRIMAQRGRFIFGATTGALEHTILPLAPPPGWTAVKLSALLSPRSAGRPAIPPLVAIRIPHEDKAKLREVVDMTYGLNSETLFPDFHGFAAAHGTLGSPLAE